ncbi:hypothetical protein MMC29_005360 [Sticta canariensis]|nr:hypothetical protein [Sticta canariensis]
MLLRRMPKMLPLLAPKPLHKLLRTYSTRGSSITEPLVDTNKIRFVPAQGEDEARLARKLNVLLEERGGRWRLAEDGKGIERCFRFKTFDSAWVYQKTFIRWTTHRPDGLSIKDVEMAAVCDEEGSCHGEIGGSVTETFDFKGKELVEAVKH